jgi:hypothetical protein
VKDPKDELLEDIERLVRMESDKRQPSGLAVQLAALLDRARMYGILSYPRP